MKPLLNGVWTYLIVGMLTACASPPRPASAPQPGSAPAVGVKSTAAAPSVGVATAVLEQTRSRWTPVPWSDLPGLADDPLHEAWNAWLKSCEKPAPAFVTLCTEVRQLSIVDNQAQLAWMQSRLQPYRVETRDGPQEGLLTGYYEPILEASRVPTADYSVPLFQPPVTLNQRKPWFSRQEIDTQPQVQALLRGREIAYLADPVDALTLQIQGSGRLRVLEVNGTQRMVRLAYAASNEQPYRSVGRWLLDQGLIRDASWPGIKAWVTQNPARVNDMLWSNPRVVFFREEPLSDFEAGFGPRGAQGVPLTPGRSIAVDPLSIPYGTPVWLASSGPQIQLQRLVQAQDTGSAIVGAVRADYFTGWGPAAAELAGRLKQPLKLWVLWPKS